MTQQKIKEKLTEFLKSYSTEAGRLNSFRVVYDYVSFLKTEPYIKEKMGSVVAYGDSQVESAIAKVRQIKEDIKPTTDIISKFGMLADEVKNLDEVAQTKDAEKLKVETGLKICYATLSAIYEVMTKVKESGGDKDNKFLNFAKEFPLKSITVKDPISDKDVLITSFQYFGIAMGAINKYLIDQIDSENFINSPAKRDDDKLDFDKDKSELNIYGVKIKIALKNDKPTDHFILEAIFANPDKTEETYFKDIAQDFIKIEDYDSSKDWNRFRNACVRLNQKVDNSTNGKIKDFILYSTGKTGWSKINSKYL